MKSAHPSVLLLASCILSVVHPVIFAQNSLTRERRIEIESLLPQWQEAKSKAALTRDVFLSGIAQDSRLNYESFRSHIEKAWSFCEGIERMEDSRQQYLSKLLHDEFSKGSISADEWLRRTDLVSKIFQIRMLFTYGNLMPRILDEATEQTGKQGRFYAGPGWGILLNQEEMRNLHKEYKELVGFPPQVLDGKNL